VGTVAATTECSRLVNDAFVDARDVPDALLLERLLPDRDRCLGDAGYVDQARGLLTNTGQFDEARTLLLEASSRATFTPDELVAQHAWVDAADCMTHGPMGRRVGAPTC